jgi:ubiquinone/menaquinone biosynthesis C-methylase UbiE
MNFQAKKQASIFLDGEADKWFERNFKVDTKRDMHNDPALKYLMGVDLSGKKILEIGCSDGWRLNQLKKRYDAECHGVEPSQEAIDVGNERYKGINFYRGTSDNLEFESDSFDCVVIGFCLYLCDRGDLFKIACEVDRVLKHGGILVITDFIPKFAYKNTYCHKDGVYSYKMNYSNMFSWNPQYTEIFMEVRSMSGNSDDTSIDSRIGVSVLRKDTEGEYPLEPFV